MKRSRSKTETEDEWLEALFAQPGAKGPAAVEDDYAPPSYQAEFWQRPRIPEPTQADIEWQLFEDPEWKEVFESVISDMKKRRVDDAAAKNRVVEKMEGPYPPGPIWFLDWSKFAPEEILRFWLGKIAHLSKYTDIHTRVPGALTRCEITMLLLMRGCEHDELKAMGMTPNILQRAVRLIKEAVMRGELPRERIPHHIWNAKSVASVKVQRNRKETRGSRWLNADGSYREPRKRDDEEEIPEEGDEDYDT